MDLQGRNVLVVGLARTGEATAEFLLRRGARVTITESKSRDELGPKAEAWLRRGAKLETIAKRLEESERLAGEELRDLIADY